MVPGTLIDGRFEISSELGSRGAEVSFRARDLSDGAPVTVRVVHRDDALEIARFEREMTILKELRHPGLVRYIAHGTTPDDKPYVVMEWLEGERLEDRLRSHRLSVSESTELIRQVSGALAFVHQRGILHRNISPAELFLCDGAIERVKILGFEIARPKSPKAHLTRAGVVIGTPSYMAPEQAGAHRELDEHADVFSLGCVAYRCLTGTTPFPGDDALSVLLKVILDEPPRARELNGDVPDHLDDLIASMLSKDISSRPGTADILAALSAAKARAAGSRRVARALTASARRTTCFVVARTGVVTAGDDMLPAAKLTAHQEALQAAVQAHGAFVCFLDQGTLVVTVGEGGAATDQAMRAARCALMLRSSLRDACIAVLASRGVREAGVARTGLGDAIEGGVALLRRTSPGDIRLDDVAAGLLETRFEVAVDDLGPSLCGERDLRSAARTLLGRATTCVGREPELSSLVGLYDECVTENRARVALLVAAAGMGKSRLLYEFVRRVEGQRAPVSLWMARGDPMHAGSPFGIVASALRRVLGLQDGEPPELVAEKVSSRVGRCFSGEDAVRVAHFLGQLAGAPLSNEEASAQLRAARQDALLMGDQLRRAWEDFVRAECRREPVILMVEDLHWGDLASVKLIDATLRNLSDQPLMVVATGRPEIAKLFPKLWAERAVTELRLGELGRRSAEKLVREVLGASVERDTIAAIVDRAAGNAFFLEELIRAAATSGGAALPETVLSMVGVRLDTESPGSRRVLRAASVFGDRFSQRGVAALVGGADFLGATGAWLEALAARELIVKDGTPDVAGDTGYAFRHALVREAAYAALTEADRVLGHRLAGAWLERQGHTDAVAMAEHFRLGHELRRAVPHYCRAAEEALEADDLAGALAQVERGIACGASGEELGALRLAAAEAHLWRGELVQAAARGTEAVELLPEGASPWFRAIHRVIDAEGKLSHVDRVEAWVKTARNTVPGQDAYSARVSCLSVGANHLTFGGRYADADAVLSELSFSDRLDAAAAGQLAQARALRALAAGDLCAFLDGLKTALSAFEQAGDRRNAALTRMNIGYVLAELGQFDGAEEVLRAALNVANQMGLDALSAGVLHNLGLALLHHGSLGEARDLLHQAIAMSGVAGESRLEGMARIYLARVHLLLRDPITAEREARAGAETLQSAPPQQAGAIGVLARTLLEQGRADEALTAAREAFSVLETLGTLEEGEALVRLVYAEALAAVGEHAASVEVIASARDRLLERAGKISDPAWRERFLTSVPDNARTLALAARGTEASGEATST